LRVEGFEHECEKGEDDMDGQDEVEISHAAKGNHVEVHPAEEVESIKLWGSHESGFAR